MRDEVFKSMLHDEIGEIDRSDPVIVSLGESWLLRNIDNAEKRRHYASQHMRLIARLLRNLRRMIDHTQNLSFFLDTKHFDAVVENAILCALPSVDEEQLQSPTNLYKLKYYIIRMVDLKWSHLVKQQKDPSDAEKFKGLIEKEWTERVTKLASSELVRKNTINKARLPSPKDITKLTLFLVNEIKTLPLTIDNFNKAVQLTEVRLLLFNKRRSGKLEMIK